jgi:transcriptional regulator with XRE-family HTH domain
VTHNQIADAERARNDAEDCGRLVAFTRQELGWTRAQLASAASLPEAEVATFEEGRTYPVNPTLEHLLRVMGRTD